MSTALHPFWIEQPEARLFAVLHASAATAEAAVLICPPLLHEAMRSQRLFAQLADALCRANHDVLRFDYAGTGDSDGADDTFTLSGAVRDAQAALQLLQRRNPRLPVRVLGVRAGAFVATRLAGASGVASLWMWQPITHGEAYLAHLRRLDAVERANPNRYRQPVATAPIEAGEVIMGFRCAPGFVDELAGAHMASSDVAGSDLCILEGTGVPSAFAGARRIDLPPALSTWVDQIDMARAPAAPIEATARALATPRGRLA